MTTTAHEDQFAPETDGAETIAYRLGQVLFDATRALASEAEAKSIATWLDKHGYREIAARIRAGEHLA